MIKKAFIFLLISIVSISVFFIVHNHNDRSNQIYGGEYIHEDVVITEYIDSNGVRHVQGEYKITPRFRRFVEIIREIFDR